MQQQISTPPANIVNEKDSQPTRLIYKILVIAALMLGVGGSLTGLMTYMNLGFTERFFQNWASSFLLTAATVMPAGAIVSAVVSTTVTKWLPNMQEHKRNLVIGVCMAIIMESLMAMTTAINNIGFNDLNALFNAWLSGFIVALPFGLVIIISLTLTIKPKLERFLKS